MKKTEFATFGAGCFWGVESAFHALPGVVQTQVGYAGGSASNPTYEQVCTDQTGHAEVLQVEFDPGVISYETLLEFFFKMHDPTTLNRQGPDIGTQYRSVIFYHTPEQHSLASRAKQAAQKDFKNPIVTQITSAPAFYAAEEYHQRYFEKKGIQPTCHFTPKDLVKR